MTANLSFTVVANNTVPVQLQVLTSSGAVYDMSGYSGKWECIDPENPTVALITKKTADASASISSSIFSFNIYPTDTVALQSGNYKTFVHELTLTDTGGNPITITNNDAQLSWGTMTVRREWTV